MVLSFSYISFSVKGTEIERVRYFKYLGRILTEDDIDTKCIDENLRNARRQWGCIAKILKREGANAACMARFYLTIVQAVLLYGADTWTVTSRDLTKLQSFHNRAARYMTGQHIRKISETSWKYPNSEELLKNVEFFPLKFI